MPETVSLLEPGRAARARPPRRRARSGRPPPSSTASSPRRRERPAPRPVLQLPATATRRAEAIPVTASSSSPNAVSSATPAVPGVLRRAPASVPATSASPECAAHTGSAPVAAASAATIPNASGNVLGTTIASLARTARATSPYSRRPPGRSSPEPPPRPPRSPAAERRGKPAGSAAPPSSPPSERAAARRDLARRAEIAGSIASQSRSRPVAVLTEADEQQSRAGVGADDERPGSEEQVGRSPGDDQLADEDHPGPSAALAAQGPRRRRDRGRDRVSQSRTPPIGSPARAPVALPEPATGATARTRRHPTPGGPSRVLSLESLEVERLPQRRAGVSRAGQDGAGPLHPLRAHRGGSARGAGSPCRRGRCRGPSPRTAGRCGRGSPAPSPGGWRERRRSRRPSATALTAVTLAAM